MTQFASDTFTETSNTALTSHTPEVGTGWTERINDTTASIIRVNGSTDVAEPDVSEGNKSILLTVDDTPGDAEYDVSGDITGSTGANAFDEGLLIGRYTATDTFYAVVWTPPGTDDIRLFKNVAGTKTSLGTFSTSYTDGDTIKFEIRDAAKKVYHNGTERISSSDNAITAAGQAGLGWGQLVIDFADVDTRMKVDNFDATDITGASIGRQSLTLMGVS